MEQVVVIGGGAAGMAAAIAAADAGSSVVLLEGGKQPGKKILSTGNGRCEPDEPGTDAFLLSYLRGTGGADGLAGDPTVWMRGNETVFRQPWPVF